MLPKDKLTVKQRSTLNHIRAALQSDTAIARYAKTHGLSAHALYYWKKKFMKNGFLTDGGDTAFIKAPPLNALVDKTIKSVTIQFPNQVRLELPAAGLDVSELLKQVSEL